MPRRRIPSWVVIVLFATTVGTGIGALAYLRRPAARPSYCAQRTPRGPLVAPLVEHGSVRARNACELRYRARAADDAPVLLTIISDRTKSWNARLVDASQNARVHPVAFEEGKARGSSIALDKEQVLVMPGREGDEAIEIRLAHDAGLPDRRAFEIAADIAAPLR
jgi:hypothetical protein